MHVSPDDIYAQNEWVQLAPALTEADSSIRCARRAGTDKDLPAPLGPRSLGKEVGPYALGPNSARTTRRNATHLTRRGRFVVVLLATFLVAVAFGAGRASATPSRSAGLPTVVVQRGDTLWSIAARIAGDDDIRETVERINALNGVTAQAIEPGQRLILPGP